MKNNKLNPEIWRDDLPVMDDNEIWANIENAMDNKKPRRFFIFWITAASILLISGLSYLLIKHNNLEKTNQNIFANITIQENKNIRENPVFTNKSNIGASEKHSTNSISNSGKRRMQPTTINDSKIITAPSQKAKHKNNKTAILTVPKPVLSTKNLEDNRSIKQPRPLKKIIFNNPVSSTVYLPQKHIVSNYLFTKNIKTNHHDIMLDNFFVTVFSGIGAPISNTVYDNNALWQRKKLNAEKALYNYSFQVQIAKPVYKNLFVALGLSYDNTVVRFIRKEKTTSVEYFQSDSAFVIKNTKTYLAGKRKKTITTTKTWTFYNNIAHWTIPVDVSYRWRRGNNSLVISSGINIRIQSVFTGNTILPGNTIGKYENNLTLINKHLGISGVRLSTYYTRILSPHLELLMGARATIAIQDDYSVKNSIFSKRYNVINIFSGFRYKL